MSESTTRLPRCRLRAWPASGGVVQMSATPEGADETTASPVWEVPAGDVAEAMAVLSAVADPEALDLKTQRDSLAHELENARRELESATSVQVWPLSRVLSEVRCGSQDWTWEEEWADLDQRHATTGYLDKLEQQIRENGITMPVLIGSDGRLWDGHHRLRIAVRAGIPYVPVEVVRNAQTPPPAPRDSHMTSEVRSLVKRYGAPAIAAEAARQAKEEGR